MTKDLHMQQIADNLVGPVLGIIATVIFDQNSLIPLGAAAGVIVTIVFMTRRWTKMEDDIEMIKRDLTNIRQGLNRLKCFNPNTLGECPVEKKENQ